MSLSHCLSQMFTFVVHSCVSYLNPKGLQCFSRWDVWLMNQYRAPYVESFPTWFSCLCFPSYVIKLSHLLLDGGSFARTWRGRPVTSVSRVIAQTLNLLINPGFAQPLFLPQRQITIEKGLVVISNPCSLKPSLGCCPKRHRSAIQPELCIISLPIDYLAMK